MELEEMGGAGNRINTLCSCIYNNAGMARLMDDI